jgi:hypothetical protein
MGVIPHLAGIQGILYQVVFITPIIMSGYVARVAGKHRGSLVIFPVEDFQISATLLIELWI